MLTRLERARAVVAHAEAIVAKAETRRRSSELVDAVDAFLQSTSCGSAEPGAEVCADETCPTCALRRAYQRLSGAAEGA